MCRTFNLNSTTCHHRHVSDWLSVFVFLRVNYFWALNIKHLTAHVEQYWYRLGFIWLQARYGLSNNIFITSIFSILETAETTHIVTSSKLQKKSSRHKRWCQDPKTVSAEVGQKIGQTFPAAVAAGVWVYVAHLVLCYSWILETLSC